MTELLLQRITQWQEKTFPKASPISKLIHLEEELKELKEEYFLPPTVERDKRIEEEYADAFLLLYGSAYKFGMSLDDINLAISKKMDKNEKRKWQEPDENGVVRHIKEEENGKN